MVTSALDARHERERELLRLVETAGNHTTIHGEDKKVVESEGKREETPREQLDIVARLNAPATITGVPSTDSTTGFVYKRRTFTLLLTEHTSRRPAPYVVPAPRSVSKVRSLLAHLCMSTLKLTPRFLSSDRIIYFIRARQYPSHLLYVPPKLFLHHSSSTLTSHLPPFPRRSFSNLFQADPANSEIPSLHHQHPLDQLFERATSSGFYPQRYGRGRPGSDQRGSDRGNGAEVEIR